MKKFVLCLIACLLLGACASQADAQRVVVRAPGVRVAVGRGVNHAGVGGFHHGVSVGVGFPLRVRTVGVGFGTGLGYGYGVDPVAAALFNQQRYAARAAFGYGYQQSLGVPLATYQQPLGVPFGSSYGYSYGAGVGTCNQPVGPVVNSPFAPQLAAPQGGCVGGCLPGIQAMLSRFGY